MQSQRRKKLDFDDNFEDDELNLKKGSTSNFNPIQDGPFRPPPPPPPPPPSVKSVTHILQR